MPFRSKLKRALGGGGDGSDTSSLSKTDSKASHNKGGGHGEKSTLPDNVYKPGEPMPRPKYRGPWNQAHQDKLSAFRFGSFSSSMGGAAREERRRRRSSAQASDYSPMGSKLPSRGPSQAPSRRGSAWSAFSGGSGSKRRGMGSRRQTQQRGGDDGLEEAAEGDADVANVGLSRQHTAEDHRGTRPTAAAAAAAAAAPAPPTTTTTLEDGIHPAIEGEEGATMSDLQMSKTATQTNPNGVPHGGGDAGGYDLQAEKTITATGNGNGHGSTPLLFTADDLAKAMSQSEIRS